MWKKVEDFPDYLVSPEGTIKSLKWGKEKILKNSVDTHGYLTVSLWKSGKMRTHRVHLLVANLFLEKVEGKPQVNHKDGNKTNPDVTNLEWVDSLGNQLHALDSGLKSTKISKEIAIAISEDCRVQSVIAEEYGVSQSLVSRIKTAKRWKRHTKGD